MVSITSTGVGTTWATSPWANTETREPPSVTSTAVREMLGADDPPTAIFASQNLVTVGAVRALRALGRSREIALVGFDDFALAELVDPPVTVVAQDPRSLGAAAADLLLRRIAGETGPPQEIVIPTELVVRGSGEIPPPT